MKKIIFVLSIFMLYAINIQLASCHSSSSRKELLEEPSMDEYTKAEGVDEIPINRQDDKPSAAPSPTKTKGGNTQSTTDRTEVVQEPVKKIEQKIIKNADIKYRVEDYKKTHALIIQAVSSHQAYISNENEINNSYNIYNDIEIRCEADKFDLLVDDILKFALYVDFKKISAEDVTEQFVDMQARLKTKKEVEERFSALLRTAKTIREILEVEKEIKYIREEIESIEGRLKYLSDKVSYSTINLHVYQDLDYVSAPEKGFGYKFIKALKAGWDGLQMFVLAIFYLWPLWLILGGILWFVLRLVKKSKRKTHQ